MAIMKLAVILLIVVGVVQLTWAHNDDLTQSIGRFSVNLFESIRLNAQTSFILSPLSVLADLSMALFGAHGQTASELQTGLQLSGCTRQQIANSFRALLQPLQQTDSALRIVNKIYVNQDYTIKPAFNRLVANSFFATAQSLDFGQSTEAAGVINAYVASHTNNLITNLVSAAMLSAETRMVLINAVYFKASWMFPFAKDDTYPETFNLETAVRVKRLDFMHKTEQFLYKELPEMSSVIVGLPYEFNRFVFNVILPKSLFGGLNRLQKRLHGKDLSRLSVGMKPRKINLSIPKFTSRRKLSLKDPLQRLGIRAAFSDAADFSDLLVDATDIKISEVVHEAYIKVDELGTEAAAATALVMVANSASLPEPEEILTVKIDRPFAYYIQDEHRNIIFYGQFAG